MQNQAENSNGTLNYRGANNPNPNSLEASVENSMKNACDNVTNEKSDNGGVDESHKITELKDGRDGEEDKKREEVPRTIGLMGAVSFIIGIIIGSGIFIAPQNVALYSGSVGMTLIIWLVSGVVCMLGALCYAELGTVVKLSGSGYIYLHESYGPWASFQFSWVNNLITKPGSLATICLTCAEYLVTPFFADFCGASPALINKLLAAAFLLTLGAINCSSVLLAKKIQIIFTIAKLITVSIIIVAGFVRLFQGHTGILSSGFEGTNTDIGLVWTAFYSGMFSYDGWNAANCMTEEIINPQRNLPLSILIAVPMVIVICLLINVSYFTVLTIPQMLSSPSVALTWADGVMPSFTWVISILVALSCFGTGNGSLFTGGRLIFVAARNNHLPAFLSMVHVDKFTPIPAICMNVLFGCVLISFGSIPKLLNFLSFVMWIFYCMSFGSVIILRLNRYKNVERPIKLPLLIPIVCFFFSLTLIFIPLITNPQLGYIFAICHIVVGYIVYIPLVHYKVHLRCTDKISNVVQRFLQVFVPVLKV